MTLFFESINQRCESLLAVPARRAQAHVGAAQVTVGALAVKGRVAAHAAQKASTTCVATALGAPQRLGL